MALPNGRIERTKSDSDVSWVWLWLTAGSLTAPLLFFVGRWYLTQPTSKGSKPHSTEIEGVKNPKLSDEQAKQVYKTPRITSLKEADLKKLLNSGVVPFAIRQPEFTSKTTIVTLHDVEVPTEQNVRDRTSTLARLTNGLAAQPATIQSQQISVSAPGRIFLFVNQANVVSKTVQASLVQGQNLVADVLRSRGFTVVEVPNSSAAQAILWINRQARSSDIALSIQADAFFNPDVRGASAFYVAGNNERRLQAERLLRQLREAVPELINRGAQPDTETAMGRLSFTRQAKVPAIVLSVGFATNPEERSLIVDRFRDIAQGIANGLETWSLAVSQTIDRVVPSIALQVNNQLCNPPGIIVDGNAYVPIEALQQLNVQPPATAQRIRARNTTYLRVIDLQRVGVIANWNPKTRTLAFSSAAPIKSEVKGNIIGRGVLSQTQLEAILRSENPQALQRFPDIAKLYLEEAAIEGVNSDVAFAQALLETNFFRFDQGISAAQNNFGGLRAIADSSPATFPSVRIGVRAHIQQLKAYANQEALARPLVSPRFRFVDRGSAPKVENLSDRWSADPNYSDRILAILSRFDRS